MNSTNRFIALIMSIVLLVVMLYSGELVVSTVQGLNTTGWTFDGHEMVETLIDRFPLIYYALGMVGFITSMYAIARSGDLWIVQVDVYSIGKRSAGYVEKVTPFLIQVNAVVGSIVGIDSLYHLLGM